MTCLRLLNTFPRSEFSALFLSWIQVVITSPGRVWVELNWLPFHLWWGRTYLTVCPFHLVSTQRRSGFECLNSKPVLTLMLGHYYQISRHFIPAIVSVSNSVVLSCWSDLWVLWNKSLPISGSLFTASLPASDQIQEANAEESDLLALVLNQSLISWSLSIPLCLA